MNLTSKFKHLVVSGCSFTHNNWHESHCVWANALAHWSCMTIDNLAIPGAGNTHIKNSIVLHLERTRPDPDNTLILVMWSGPERIDWITDKNSSKFREKYPFSYDYTQNNELTLGGNWWANKAESHLLQTLIEYSKYQSGSSLALNSWIQIQDLENYLKCNNYEYYFLSWFNYNDPIHSGNCWINFDQECNQMGLSRPTWQWLATDVDKSLGRWTQNRPEYLWTDKLHPTWQGHEAWLRAVLVPELIEKKVLYEHST